MKVIAIFLIFSPTIMGDDYAKQVAITPPISKQACEDIKDMYKKYQYVRVNCVEIGAGL